MDDEPSKNFEDSRYGYQDARTFEPDLAADFLRTSRGNENDGSRNQWRNECCERLPKQVAHGQQIENAQRRKGTDVPEARGELFFDGPEARGKPPRAAFGPDHHGVAFPDARRTQPATERLRDPGNLTIAPGPSAVTIIVDDELAWNFRNPIEKRG